jgi:hypothetical protein
MPEKIQITLEIDDKGSIKIGDVKGKVDDLGKTVETSSKGPLKNFQEGWGLITAKITAAIAVIYSIKKIFYDLPLSIASATNEIERQAGVLGISTDKFQKWQYAAKMSDVNVQELAIGLKMLSRNMEDVSKGAGESSKYFSAMGISVKDAEGHLRPLSSVMMDIMDKFAIWEDGPRKIAIAMQLFGRSGETLIPLLNKGKNGFNELAKEAEKLGIILSPDLIRKGSEAEDILKKISAQLQAFKLSLAPSALEVVKFGNDIIEVFKKIMEPPRQFLKLMDEISTAWMKLGQKIGVVPKPPGSEEFRYLAAYQARPKVQPPEAMKEVDIVKEVQAAIEAVTAAEEQRGIVANAQFELRESGYTKEKDIVAQVREEIERLEREENERGEIAVARQALKETTDAAAAKAEEDRINESIANARLLYEGWLEEYTKLDNQMKLNWDSIGESFSDIWAFNMTKMISDAENAGKVFKNVFQNMADVFISAVTKMIVEWLIFENVQGGKKTFLGAGSGIGSIIKTIGSLFLKEGGVALGFRPLAQIPRFQSGGVIDRPTLAMVGEGGEREWIIPDSKMGKGSSQGTTIINLRINAVDAGSFIQLCKRNPEGILSAVGADMKTAGGMRSMIKSSY